MKHCTVCKAKYDDSVSFCPTDGEVLEDDPSSIVNTVLDGQYQIEALLGKGGMGAVYSARHILLGDRVAIKILPPEVRNNAEWLRRFRREGQAARRFRHPNAVTVYDLRTAGDSTIYMVMEHVEGHTLDAELKQHGRFTAAEAFAILEPIISVLDTAHSMGVVHRDLKPENIMVGKPTGDGGRVVKLLDLGIAKMREIAGVDSAGGNTALTMAGQVLGTPYYMSPEQWGEIPRDENQEIDGRADLYSLGLVFYELISGRRCYSAATLHELRREHISTTPRPLIAAVPEVPQGFSDAIVRATAKDRGDRQATASQLATELRASLGAGGASHAQAVKRNPADSLAETLAVSSVDTSSDLNAPTIIERSPSPTAIPSERSRAAAPVPHNGESGKAKAVSTPPAVMSAPTLAESADMASSITIAQTPRAEVVVPPAKGNSIVPIVLGALVLVLLVAGVGGFLVLKWMRAKPNQATSVTEPTSSVPVPQELGRYWLELEDPPARVAGSDPIASGKTFKVHLQFPEDGYVYLVGPGNKNLPTPFLTAKPPVGSGLQTNQTKQGADFSFPSGSPNWLTLDSKPGAENYTVIFSRTPLTTPAFFDALANPAKPLSQAEQAELTEFLAKYKEKPPTAEVGDSIKSPFVRVKGLPIGPNSPVVFDIRIQHK